jgi:hypothetical protein
MCQNQTEDWRNVLTCPSLEAALHIADSWGQLQKSPQRWKLPVDFSGQLWKRELRPCISDPKKAKDRELPVTSFPATLNRKRKALKSAYHAQLKIGWQNCTKERIAEEWITLIEAQYANNGYKLKARDWAPKFISALWEHMQRVWKFRNDIYHAANNERTARYKREEQQRRMEKI